MCIQILVELCWQEPDNVRMLWDTIMEVGSGVVLTGWWPCKSYRVLNVSQLKASACYCVLEELFQFCLFFFIYFEHVFIMPDSLILVSRGFRAQMTACEKCDFEIYLATVNFKKWHSRWTLVPFRGTMCVIKMLTAWSLYNWTKTANPIFPLELRVTNLWFCRN